MHIGDEILALAAGEQIETRPPDTREVGVDLNLPFTGSYKNQWEVLRHEDVSVEKLASMRKLDGQARALYRLITLPIMSALKGYTIIPAKGQEGGEDEAAFIEKMFSLPAHAGGMEVPLRKVMQHFLLAVFDGFSAAELVIHSPLTGPLKDKWTVRKIAPRPSETLTFVIDPKTGQFNGIRQRAYLNGNAIDVTIPKDRALYLAMQEEECAFYGESMFKPAFFAWDKKMRLYYLGYQMMQRSAVGTRLGTYPKAGANPKSIREFTRGVSDLGMNQWLVMEEGYKVETLKEGGSADVLGFINHFNSQMSTSLLANFFDKNQGAGQNDRSFVDFGQQSDALFQLMLDSIIADIEDLVNLKIIPQFIKWNFGTDMYPTFKWGPVSQDQRSIVVEMFKQLMVGSNQGNITRERVFEMERLTAEFTGTKLDYDKLWKQMQEKWAKEDREAAESQKQQKRVMSLQEEQQRQAIEPATTTPTGASVDQPLDIPSDLLGEMFQQ